MRPVAFGLIAALLAAAWFIYKLHRRNVLRWVGSYVRGDWPGRREAPSGEVVDVMFCLADHFEPAVGKVDAATERRRMDHWRREYPRLAQSFRDADGRPPRHTFFFPAEQYRPEHMDALAELARGGYGETEVHLHHDNDTSVKLRETLLEFRQKLRAHGHLGANRISGETRYAFVHGNWALDNSRPDGRWCGVNDELIVLRETGCYADFTLPSAPAPTQTRRINSIYYAADDPQRPRSHEDGVPVRAGGHAEGDLMIVQGPLGMIWPGGKFGLLPRLENGNLARGSAPAARRRLACWIRSRVCVSGRPDWLFIKVHTHGCFEPNWPMLFGDGMRALHRTLNDHYNDGRRYRLHYVTAREMYNIIKAAERGLTGNPGEYRDLEIAPPPCVRL